MPRRGGEALHSPRARRPLKTRALDDRHCFFPHCVALLVARALIEILLCNTTLKCVRYRAQQSQLSKTLFDFTLGSSVLRYASHETY